MPKPKILLISITRMGDLIQSIPFVESLKKKCPDADIDILVEDCFAEVAQMISGISTIHSVKLDDLLLNFDAVRQANITMAMSFYLDLIEKLKKENYTEVWNLTHTRPSMYLNFLIAGEKGKGVTLDESGFQKVNSAWLRYFFATNLARPWCQFNLIDIYANATEQYNDEKPRRLFFKTDTARKRKNTAIKRSCKIAVHIGASQFVKQWPFEYFNQLINLLTNHEKVSIVLVGGKGDIKAGESLSRNSAIENFIGKTSPGELAELLSECDLLISNDSGPMHIAAAAGTKVIAITVGTALGSETAPYGKDHWVIEPNADCFPAEARNPCKACACSKQISPELIYQIATYELNLNRSISEECLNGARVYQTDFDERTGMLALSRRFSEEECLRDKLNQFIAPYWYAVLNKHSVPISSGCKNIDSNIHSSASEALETQFGISSLLQLMLSSVKSKKQDVVFVKQSGEQLDKLERELEKKLSKDDFLKCFHIYLQISKASISSAELSVQLRETIEIYEQIYQLLQAVVGNEIITNTKYSANKKDYDYENQNQRLLPA